MNTNKYQYYSAELMFTCIYFTIDNIFIFLDKIVRSN